MSLPLLTAISAIDLTISVEGQITDASGPGIITIESEQIAYVGNSVNQFLGLTRGYNGTTAVAHAVGTRLTYVPNEPAGIGDITGMLPVNVSGGIGVLVGGSATISIPVASTSVSGYLSSLDWNSFEGRVNKAGDTMTGALDMAFSAIRNAGLDTADLLTDLDASSFKIINLSDPLSAQDAATKNYVDTHAGAIGANGTVQLSDGSGGFTSSVPNLSFLLDDGFGSTQLEIKQNGQHTNTLRFNGENSYIAAYADDDTTRIAYIQMETGAGIILYDSPSAAQLEVYNGQVSLTNAVLTMNGNSIINVPDPVNPQDAATKNYVDTANGAPFVPLSGGTMTGDLHLDPNNDVFARQLNATQVVTTPEVTSLPLTQLNIWSRDNTAIGVSFGSNADTHTVAHFDMLANTLDMEGHLIINVTDPSNPQDAATKAYVDSHSSGAPNYFENDNPQTTDNDASTSNDIASGPILTLTPSSVSAAIEVFMNMSAQFITTGGTIGSHVYKIWRDTTATNGQPVTDGTQVGSSIVLQMDPATGTDIRYAFVHGVDVPGDTNPHTYSFSVSAAVNTMSTIEVADIFSSIAKEIH